MKAVLAAVIVLAAALVLAAAPAAAAPLAGAGDPGCQALLDYSAAHRGVAVLALRNGKPICEGYGADATPDRGYEIWSGTKSFTGLMAAAAVQDGLMKLDEPVADTLAEWKTDPQKARVTIRQLLGLISGMASEVGKPPTFADAVAMPLTAAAGERFQYGPAPFQVFGEVMRRKLKAAGKPSDPLDYLRARLLEPIGLKPADWRRLPNGDPLFPQGAVLTVREWVKLGEFVRAGGKANGKQIVDPAAFRELFKGSATNAAYGISWWLPHASTSPDPVTTGLDLTRHSGEVPGDLVLAAGAGNQRLYVIPSLGLTVAREAIMPGPGERAGPAGPWSDTAFVKLALTLK